MIIELIVALVVGILIGTITGLTPGLHINLVSTILLSLSPLLLKLTPPLSLAVFIVAMSITHTFLDYIPSIFLGAPDDISFLSVLPGHKLLLEGKGYYAVVFSLYGSLTGILLLWIIAPISIFILPIIYPYFVNIMAPLLILFSIYLISTEKQDWPKALLIFILSGFLGIAVLNNNIKEPLLPLFTGLFGSSALLISLKQKTKIPEQNISHLKDIKINKKSFFDSSIISLLISPLTAFLPGLGSSQAAIIATELKEKTDERDFLFMVGILNVLIMALSFVALYSIEKTRTGSAVAVSKLIPHISFNNLSVIMTAIILSGFISFYLSVFIAKSFSKAISKISYIKISLLVLLIITFFVLFLSGLLGLIVFMTSTSLGIYCILENIKRTHLMGCLLIPTILYYLF